MKRLTREQLATRVARDIPEGAYVNLGIGMPTLVANYLPRDREIFLHSENGILGMGPAPAPGEEDPDLINAGKQPVTLLPGGSFFHHADSFAMMRGGHLDICVLGAFEVSASGDLANWHTGAADAILTAAGLSYLGLGLEISTPGDWGRDLADAQSFLGDGIWWTSLFPGLMIILLTVGLSFLGEGLNDMINPLLKKERA